MNRLLVLVLLVSVFFSGCGEIEWFPDNYGANIGNTTNSPILTKVYKPPTIVAGTNSTLTFTISNATASPAQSGLGFTDQLSADLAVSAISPQCGGTVSVSGSKITFTGGLLAAGVTSCTITTKIVAAPAGRFINKKSDVTGLTGGLVNSVTDQTLTATPATTFTRDAVTVYNVTGANTATNPETFRISGNAINTATTDANITVDIIALDINGAEITSTATQVTDHVPAGTTIAIPLSPKTVTIPLNDATKIRSWRIVNLTVL